MKFTLAQDIYLYIVYKGNNKFSYEEVKERFNDVLPEENVGEMWMDLNCKGIGFVDSLAPHNPIKLTPYGLGYVISKLNMLRGSFDVLKGTSSL